MCFGLLCLSSLYFFAPGQDGYLKDLGGAYGTCYEYAAMNMLDKKSLIHQTKGQGTWLSCPRECFHISNLQAESDGTDEKVRLEKDQ